MRRDTGEGEVMSIKKAPPEESGAKILTKAMKLSSLCLWGQNKMEVLFNISIYFVNKYQSQGLFTVPYPQEISYRVNSGHG